MGPESSPNPMAMLMPLAFMFGIFYLLVWRPQSQARKQHELLLKNLKKNDEVVTNGGMFGTVLNVKPESITLRVDDNVRIELEKTAIARVVKPRGDGAPSEEKKI